MPKLRRLLPVLTVLLLPSALAAADSSLLRLVMPDAKVIAGLQVDRTRNSQFGQFVLSHMQLDDASFQDFVARTGFDPRHDVAEILMASNWQSSTPQSRWLLLAKGVFDIPKLQQAAQSAGAVASSFQGTSIYSYTGRSAPNADNAIAFLDSSSAVMGDLASVKAAIARQQSNAVASGDLIKTVGDLSANNDFWFVTLVPLSEFAGAIPNPNVSSAMQGNTLAAINQASGGIRFGDTVTISAQAITRSDKDAQALVDVVKFVVSMLQLNRQNNAVAGQVASLLDTLDTKTSGNTMSMSLAIPEQQLEQIIGQAPRPRADKKPVPQS
ncbi:MAG TPA: hypothetical protein VKX49_13645 [Bryobacteraceae bacterium]|nr:hypothetical protein [Bryobacteraceae bacterium]